MKKVDFIFQLCEEENYLHIKFRESFSVFNAK
jgi:hypothetical protein